MMVGLIEAGRRRAFVFFFVPVAIIFTVEAFLESDIFTHYIDDSVDVALALIALAYLAVTWKNASKLGGANRIATVIAVLIIGATLYAITQEFNDPEDFGNEIPTISMGLVLIVNGLLGGVPGYKPAEGSGSAIDQAKIDKELMRRRASSLFLVFVLLAAAYFAFAGPYDLRSIAIEAALFVAALVGLASGVQSRHDFTFKGLRRVNNVLVAISVVLLVLSLVGGIPPLLFFSVAFVVNRFV